jgi:hypothetical protein
MRLVRKERRIFKIHYKGYNKYSRISVAILTLLILDNTVNMKMAPKRNPYSYIYFLSLLEYCFSI